MSEHVRNQEIPERRQIHGIGPDRLVIERKNMQQPNKVIHVGISKKTTPLLLRLAPLNL